jgi:hypothetical protein
VVRLSLPDQGADAIATDEMLKVQRTLVPAASMVLVSTLAMDFDARLSPSAQAALFVGVLSLSFMSALFCSFLLIHPWQEVRGENSSTVKLILCFLSPTRTFSTGWTV